jgi:preprotein translocase subunit SecB
MESKEQVKLKFKGVDFPFVKVKSKSIYNDSDEMDIDVNIHPQYFLPKGSLNKFHIVMNVTINVADCLDIEISAIGTFILSGVEGDEDIRKQFINANAPAIMFPYVRAFVSTLTSNLGKITSSITLPTRFFKGELEEMQTDERNLIEHPSSPTNDD